MMVHRKYKRIIILISLILLLIIIPGLIFANHELYEKGLKLIQQGKIEEAKIIFKKIFTETPNDYYAPYAMYQYARLLEKVDDVLHYLKKITKIYSDFNNLDVVYNDIATIYFLLEKYEQSKQYFYTLYKQFTRSQLSIRAMYYIGKCLFKEKKLDKAINFYDGLYRSFPKSYYAALALFELGYTYEYKKDFDRALMYYNKMQEEYPDSDAISKALYRQLRIYLSIKKDYEKGQKLMALILVKYSKSFEADFVRMLLADSNIDEEKFIESYYGKNKETKNEENLSTNLEEKYYIQLGAFSNKEYAENYAKKINDKGFRAFVVNKKELYPLSTQDLFLVIIGFFKDKKTTKEVIDKLKAKGFDCYISKIS